MTATLTKWYQENGKHEIFAGGKQVALPSADHSLVLRIEDVQHAKQTDLDKLGIAKTAREEKKRARDHKLHEQQENERMAKLYRQHVLKEEPGPEEKKAVWGNQGGFFVAHALVRAAFTLMGTP